MAKLTVPATPLVRVSCVSGRVTVVAEDRIDVEVAGTDDVRHTAGTTTVSTTSGRLEVRVPSGTDIVVGATSGGVSVRGVVGAASITVETGKVVVEHAASLDARSRSGAIEVGSCDGACRVRSATGKIVVGSCGSADVATTSGRISLRDVRGAAVAHCSTGQISIELAGASDVEAETITGRVTVSVPKGVRPLVIGPGDEPSATDVDSSVDDGSVCTVTARSVNGQVKVVNR